MSLIDRVAGALAHRTSRRGFLVRAAVVGSALAVDPLDYVLHPGTAYGYVCRCGDASCRCGSLCCDGYTEFCCTTTGSNTCPPGTFAGGWWRADGSTFCGGGPRYYIDCHSECPTQGAPGFCAAEDGLTCGCAMGDCTNRVVGCVSFRYGQCHQDIATVGRIACRVVTCTPAYLLDNACTSQVLVNDQTAEHNRPCLQDPAVVRRAYATAVNFDGTGAWFASQAGVVAATGSATAYGSVVTLAPHAPIVGMAATSDGLGYWLASSEGDVWAFGSAPGHGSMSGHRLLAPVVSMTATPDGQGYWLLASDGGVFSFGSAGFHGSMGGIPLALPLVGMAATPDGRGYWMVASDGGVFSFGSAAFHGSTGGKPLRALVAGIVATPTGAGYWLWGQDGAVYPFGDAVDLGGYPTLPAPQAAPPPAPPAAPQPAPQPALPSAAIDAFYAFAPHPEGGYTLWAASPLGPPPTVVSFVFTPVAPSA